MKKAYEFRIYPSLEQEEQFKKANGLCRLYWNTVLAQKKEAWENKEKYSIGTINKTFEKTKPEVLEWTKEVDSTIFAAEWKIITSAFNNYFKAKSGKLTHYVGEPKFKSKKKDKISITFTSQNKPRILKNGYLFLTRKLGPIKGYFIDELREKCYMQQSLKQKQENGLSKYASTKKTIKRIQTEKVLE